MIRPAAFGFNEETAATNYFQSNPGINKAELQAKALHEFNNMVQTLRDHAIDVLVFDDTTDPAKPDAVFPNNWLSTSPDGKVNIFPLFASSRRPEKRNDIVRFLEENFVVNEVKDWSQFE
jgi:hypothetical protein